MAEFNVLGQNHIRVDSLEKVTGQATYASDVYLPDMLLCKLLTSPRSHARILSIDVSEAQKAPGVRAVITGADFPDAYFGSGQSKTGESWPGTRCSTSGSRGCRGRR